MREPPAAKIAFDERLGDQISLRFLAAERTQEIELRIGFDAFSGAAQAQ